MAEEKTVERARDAVAEGLEAAREKFESAAEELESRARLTQRELKRRAQEMGEAAREQYAKVATKVREGYLRARKGGEELSHDVADYVRENPGKSVLIAAAAGFLVGLLLSSRRRGD